MTESIDNEPSGGLEGRETWSKLAIKLGFSVQSLKNWRKREGAPQTPDLDAWETYIDVQQLGIAGNRTSDSREDLLKENLKKKNRLLDLQIAREERQSIDRTVVDQLFLRLASLQKTVLYQHLEKQMPAKAVGHGAAIEPMQKLGREIADALCEIFNQEMDRWQNST